ncbi:MAG: hypothetical protein KKE20_03690 [Nanoarchaeota archaeon]|nr:hypothetical protein [Nanoarchaeota archaeon]
MEMLIKAAMQAGNELMENYFQKEFKIGQKSDGSVISDADFAAQKAIMRIMDDLKKSGVPIRSEEVKEDEAFRAFIQGSDRVFIVDPLDGSKEFTKGLDEFAISIAMVERGTPIQGVVYAPARDLMMYAEKGKGGVKIHDGIETVLRTSDQRDFSKMRLLVSSSELNMKAYPDFVRNLERLGYSVDSDQRVQALGSTTLKTAMIASGDGDYNFTFTAWDQKKGKMRITKEWDIAATYLLVREAGGMMTDCAGNDFVFGKQDPKNYLGIFTSNSAENHYGLLKHVTEGIDLEMIKKPR